MPGGTRTTASGGSAYFYRGDLVGEIAWRTPMCTADRPLLGQPGQREAEGSERDSVLCGCQCISRWRRPRYKPLARTMYRRSSEGRCRRCCLLSHSLRRSGEYSEPIYGAVIADWPDVRRRVAEIDLSGECPFGQDGLPWFPSGMLMSSAGFSVSGGGMVVVVFGIRCRGVGWLRYAYLCRGWAEVIVAVAVADLGLPVRGGRRGFRGGECGELPDGFLGRCGVLFGRAMVRDRRGWANGGSGLRVGRVSGWRCVRG